MLNNFGILGPHIARCAQPDARGFADLRALGYTTVIKLNSDEDYSHVREAQESGGVVVHCPLSAMCPDNAAVRRLVGEMRDLLAAGERLVVHCTLGRDRTGYVMAAYQMLALGASLAETAVERAHFSEGLSRWLFEPSIERALADLQPESAR